MNILSDHAFTPEEIHTGMVLLAALASIFLLIATILMPLAVWGIYNTVRRIERQQLHFAKWLENEFMPRFSRPVDRV